MPVCAFPVARSAPRRPRRLAPPRRCPLCRPQDGKIKSLEQIYLFSLPIKEHQIADFFLKDKLKDEVMQIASVQKQTSAGQRTRFVCYVAVGDCERRARRLPRPRRVIYLWRSRRTYGYNVRCEASECGSASTGCSNLVGRPSTPRFDRRCVVSTVR